MSRITPLVLLLVLLLPQAVPGAVDFGALDAYVAGRMRAGSIPGLAYAVVLEGEVVHLAAFGQARADGTPMTVDTPMWLGSVGKTITGLVIRRLELDGRLDLDEPVTRYLPEFQVNGPGGAAQITVRHLLEHTSGIPQSAGIDPGLYSRQQTARSLVSELGMVRLNRPVGESYEYSNLNFVILGALVEAVTGQLFGEYVQTQVFTPLGMNHSYATKCEADTAGVATGYRILYGFPVWADEPYPLGMSAAGFLISSARDMATYAAALTSSGMHQGRSIVTPGGKPEAGTHYGLYWQPLERVAYGDSLSHSGSTLGFSSNLTIFPAQRLAVVVLANANTAQVLPDTLSAYTIATGVARSLQGQPSPAPALPVGRLYIAIDLILLAGVGGTAFGLVRLARGRGSWGAAVGLGLFVLLALPVLVEYLAGGMFIPSPLQAWRILLFVLPDIFSPVLGCGLALLLGGAARLTWERAAGKAVPRGVSVRRE